MDWVSSLAGWLVGWLAGQPAGQLVGWVGWLVSLVGWLAGWPACMLACLARLSACLLELDEWVDGGFGLTLVWFSRAKVQTQDL